jgi:hypothetical protein
VKLSNQSASGCSKACSTFREVHLRGSEARLIGLVVFICVFVFPEGISLLKKSQLIAIDCTSG